MSVNSVKVFDVQFMHNIWKTHLPIILFVDIRSIVQSPIDDKYTSIFLWDYLSLIAYITYACGIVMMCGKYLGHVENLSLNLDLDIKLIKLKCHDFKLIDFRYHFKFNDFKSIKILGGFVKCKSLTSFKTSKQSI